MAISNDICFDHCQDHEIHVWHVDILSPVSFGRPLTEDIALLSDEEATGHSSTEIATVTRRQAFITCGTTNQKDYLKLEQIQRDIEHINLRPWYAVFSGEAVQSFH